MHIWERPPFFAQYRHTVNGGGVARAQRSALSRLAGEVILIKKLCYIAVSNGGAGYAYVPAYIAHAGRVAVFLKAFAYIVVYTLLFLAEYRSVAHIVSRLSCV